MSLPEITQENVHLFIPLKAAKVTEIYAKKHCISKKQALLEFYNSKVYDELEQEDTKLWYEGPTYLYMELEIENTKQE